MKETNTMSMNIDEILARGKVMWSKENVAKRQAELEARWQREIDAPAKARRNAFKIYHPRVDTLGASQSNEIQQPHIVYRSEKKTASKRVETKAMSARNKLRVLHVGQERDAIFKCCLKCLLKVDKENTERKTLAQLKEEFYFNCDKVEADLKKGIVCF